MPLPSRTVAMLEAIRIMEKHQRRLEAGETIKPDQVDWSDATRRMAEIAALREFLRTLPSPILFGPPAGEAPFRAIGGFMIDDFALEANRRHDHVIDAMRYAYTAQPAPRKLGRRERLALRVRAWLCEHGIHRPLFGHTPAFTDRVSGLTVYHATCMCGAQWQVDSRKPWGGSKIRLESAKVAP